MEEEEEDKRENEAENDEKKENEEERENEKREEKQEEKGEEKQGEDKEEEVEGDKEEKEAADDKEEKEEVKVEEVPKGEGAQEETKKAETNEEGVPVGGNFVVAATPTPWADTVGAEEARDGVSPPVYAAGRVGIPTCTPREAGLSFYDMLTILRRAVSPLGDREQDEADEYNGLAGADEKEDVAEEEKTDMEGVPVGGAFVVAATATCRADTAGAVEAGRRVERPIHAAGDGRVYSIRPTHQEFPERNPVVMQVCFTDGDKASTYGGSVGTSVPFCNFEDALQRCHGHCNILNVPKGIALLSLYSPDNRQRGLVEFV